ENIGHRKGSFLLQYDETEMRLAEPVDEVEIVAEDNVQPEVSVGDNENQVPVQVPVEKNEVLVEENIGSSSEANSYKAKYQFVRALIEKLRTNAKNVLSEEEESLLAKYDVEDREQQPI
ncbi:hypothetical protein MKW92_043328, partial [Papaver armeniacum]